jgi:thiol-disulfide isomerase/thioredoxin
MTRLLTLLFLLSLVSCQQKAKNLDGNWRGVLEIQNKQLPFNFSIERDTAGGYDLIIQNAEERIRLDEVTFINDSLNAVMHIFDAYLRAAIVGDSMMGLFNLNYDPSYKIPFKAALNQSFRFIPKDTLAASPDFSGSYQVQFFNPKDTVNAIAVFSQKGNYAEGSFLTPTGDYRYLEGSVIDDTLYLSTFDGNHAFLFKATRSNDSTLTGGHWLGKSRYRTWSATKKNRPVLPDPEKLTYLKEGYDKIDFSFPDVNNVKVTPNDEKFKNKVLILQLFGTWCPNCLDETKFLAPWYLENKDRGVEIVGLAYERSSDFTYASERVKKMKDKLGIEYDFVIAGVNDNAKAAETLPMLNRIVAFPTTIFIGKDGKVKYIHTGFSGPGTGNYYLEFKEEFNRKVNELLEEEVAID